MRKQSVEERLTELGFKLPVVAKPVAEYVPAKRVGDLVYVSGQGPIRDGKPVYVGQVGAEVSPEEAYQAAQVCALNCLAAVESAVSSLNEICNRTSLQDKNVLPLLLKGGGPNAEILV